MTKLEQAARQPLATCRPGADVQLLIKGPGGTGVVFGMYLRDYFAAKAMQGSLSNAGDVTSMARFAEWCYEMADAMLEARNEE